MIDPVQQKKLVVQQAKIDDLSSVQISPTTLNQLKIFKGDAILIYGKVRKSTIAVVLNDSQLPKGSIRINKTMRRNLRVNVGDQIQIGGIQDLSNLTKIHILPLKSTSENFTGDLTKKILVPFFRDKYRPIKKGDIVSVQDNNLIAEFKIVATEPREYGIVAPNTMLYTQGEPIDLEKEQAEEIGFDDIGGYKQKINTIRQILLLRCLNPSPLKSLGVKSPGGILLYGKTGTGKTRIARAIANQTGYFFFAVNGSQIMSKMPGQAQSYLRKVFEEAQKQSPSIIFIEEISSIGRKRSNVGDEQHQAINQLLVLMDGIKQRGDILVIGTTVNPNNLDPAFRRFGRFDYEIQLGVPNQSQRLQLLKIHTKKMATSGNVNLKLLAEKTQHYVGADIAALCTQSAINCIREYINVSDYNNGEKINPQIIQKMVVTQQHFQSGLKTIIPIFKREQTQDVQSKESMS